MRSLSLSLSYAKLHIDQLIRLGQKRYLDQVVTLLAGLAKTVFFLSLSFVSC